MGQTQLLMDWLAKIHDRFGTPSRAITLTGIGIIVLIVLGVGINVLAEVAIFVYLLTYGLVHVAVIRLHRHDDAYNLEFQMPEVLFPAVPVIGMIATLAIMSQMNLIVIAGGVLIVIVATIWYYFYVRQISD